jgi:hypothetical protein
VARNLLIYGPFAAAVLIVQIVLYLVAPQGSVPTYALLCGLSMPVRRVRAGLGHDRFVYGDKQTRVDRTPILGAIVCLTPVLLTCMGVGLVALFPINLTSEGAQRGQRRRGQGQRRRFGRRSRAAAANGIQQVNDQLEDAWRLLRMTAIGSFHPVGGLGDRPAWNRPAPGSDEAAQLTRAAMDAADTFRTVI